MYENHFNLQERPFRNIPDTKMFFDDSDRGEILRALCYAIDSGEGIIKVVGEVGSGKTMLCRKLNEVLPENVKVVFLANPSLEPEYILHAVAKELGIRVSLKSNRLSVQQSLQKFLVKQHQQGNRVIVLIEEAQCMPPRTLEEIRLMSNLETEKHKLLQLVLFGQPELDEILDRGDLRQFNERISYALYLKPFSLDDVTHYLHHRLTTAGYDGPALFNTDVIKQIYKFSKGSLRRINLLADKILLAAYTNNEKKITLKHARLAIEDSKYIDQVKKTLPYQYIVPAGITVVAILFFWLGSLNSKTDEKTILPAQMSSEKSDILQDKTNQDKTEKDVSVPDSSAISKKNYHTNTSLSLEKHKNNV